MRRRIVLLAVAVLLALVGTAAVAAYVAGADNRALSATTAVEVVVAARDIPKGTSIDLLRSEGMTALVRFPTTTVPPDALTTLNTVTPGAVTTRDVAAREILLSGTLGVDQAPRDTAAGLTLPPGTSAVPVSFKSFAHAEDWSGWIQPGAEIALYDTFTPRNPAGPWTPRGDDLASGKDDNQVTRLLLERVKVLAVGSAPAGADSSEKSSSSGGATTPALVLALTQQQSEQLLMGLARESKLYPVLLAPGSRVSPSPGTIDTRLFDPAAPVPPTTAPSPAAPSPPATAATAPATPAPSGGGS